MMLAHSFGDVLISIIMAIAGTGCVGVFLLIQWKMRDGNNEDDF